MLKKQAVNREAATAEKTSDPVAVRPRERRSHSAESGRPSKMDITSSLKPLRSDKVQSGLRRAPSLKENFKDSARDIASQSKVEKTGKNDSKF